MASLASPLASSLGATVAYCFPKEKDILTHLAKVIFPTEEIPVLIDEHKIITDKMKLYVATKRMDTAIARVFSGQNIALEDFERTIVVRMYELRTSLKAVDLLLVDTDLPDVEFHLMVRALTKALPDCAKVDRVALCALNKCRSSSSESSSTFSGDGYSVRPGSGLSHSSSHSSFKRVVRSRSGSSIPEGGET